MGAIFGDTRKILVPNLHVKMGLMEKFDVVLHKESTAFKHVQRLNPMLFEAKVKAGIFVRQQIKKPNVFILRLLKAKEKEAWINFFK